MRIVAMVVFAVLAVACSPRVRVAVEPSRIPPLIDSMHSLRVESYGRHGSCDYLIDARGAYVSDLRKDDCDPFAGDDEVALEFDQTARRELARLREEEGVLGLPRIIGIDLAYDEHGLLTYAGFAVDTCSAYNAPFDPPRDLDQADPFGPRPIPWSILDVCAVDDAT